MDDEHESEEARNERRHFQTIFQSSRQVCDSVSMNEYINRRNGNTLNAYKCQIRGMTKESVLSNKIGRTISLSIFFKRLKQIRYSISCVMKICSHSMSTL